MRKKNTIEGSLSKHLKSLAIKVEGVGEGPKRRPLPHTAPQLLADG